jgi:hypothetical protein
MLKPLRPLFAWALLGYAAIEIFFAFARLAEPSGGSISARAHTSDFTTLVSIGFPLLAVLIATQIEPVLGIARLVSLIALGELAAVLLLGSMAFLIGLPHAVLNTDRFSSMLAYLAFSVAGLAFAALSGVACLRVLGTRGFTLPGEGSA